MGIIKDNKKFESTKEQDTPANPTLGNDEQKNKFDIDEKTIKKQQNKK